MKKRKILITGAAGFVGRNFVTRCRRELSYFDTLLLIYKKGDKKEEKIEALFRKWDFKLKKVDLINSKDLTKLNFNPDIVIHLAASTDTSQKNHQTNDIGTKNLIESFKKFGPEAHFIYTSTTAIYAGRGNCKEPIDDYTSPQPSNEYGRTKLKAEKYLEEEAKKKKFRLTILRLSTVYGTNTRENGLFSILKKAIKSGGIISRLNWPGLTSLVHVDEVSDALWKIAQSPPPPGKPEIFIVLSDSLTMSGISKFMHKEMGVKYKEFRLSRMVWELASYTRVLNSGVERLLPYSFYNIFSRLSLISDHALWCESYTLKKRLQDWEPRKFSEGVKDVVA